MREKYFLAGCIGICCLLYLIVIAGNLYTVRYGAEQYQAVVGNLYQENPEAARELLFVTFDREKTEKSMQSGLKAAKELGYTEDAYMVYYHREFQEKSWILFFAVTFILLGLLCAAIRRRETFFVQKTAQLNRRIRRYESGEAEFEIGKSAGGEWLSLEYQILQLMKDRERQQSYFVKRQEQMQMFMENIAHQVKTPLSCILLNLELLHDKVQQAGAGISGRSGCGSGNEDTTSRDMVRLIMDSVSQGERIRRLLLQLLNLARLEAGKIHFRMEKVSIKELLREIQVSFPEGTVLVLNDGGETDQQWIWGDRQWIFEAIFNLVDNSVKYAGDTPVKVQVQALRETIRLMVQDFGDGLSAEELQHIFERYYMGNTTDGFRTGIGLNISKYVIAGHHGTLRAKSAIGGGTVMEINLPKLRWKEKVTV